MSIFIKRMDPEAYCGHSPLWHMLAFMQDLTCAERLQTFSSLTLVMA